MTVDEWGSDGVPSTDGSSSKDETNEKVALRAANARDALASKPSNPRRVVRLESFEEPQHFSDEAERNAYRRRFLTLFADEESARRGGLGKVLHVVNALGEDFALKIMIAPQQEAGESDESHADRVEAARKAFAHEYSCQRAFNGFKGFPRLYGRGEVDGVPAIVMEWVDGCTLARAAAELAADDAARLCPLVAARLGRDLFALLERMSLVDDGFVHRDISPANVMVRTGRFSLADQVEQGTFDLCLIDFGSSSALEASPQSAFTQASSVLRRGTPAYAAPEMLTDDLRDLEDLRHAPAVDVYAAASVVFELVGGRPPFDLSYAGTGGDGKAAPHLSPYLVKTDTAPVSLVSVHTSENDLAAVLSYEPEVAVAAADAVAALGSELSTNDFARALRLVDAQLGELLLPCLSAKQAERPTARAMHEGLSTFAENYRINIARALRGEELLPCTAGAVWANEASPYAVRRTVRTAARTVALAVVLVIVAITSLLVDGVGTTLRAGSFTWSGALGAPLAAAALLLPSVMALLARGRDATSRAGFLRGTAGLLVGTALLITLFMQLSFSTVEVARGVAASIFAVVAASWCPIALDYALTVAPAIRVEMRRRLEQGEGAAQDAAFGAGASAPMGAATVLGSLQEGSDD